MTKFFARSRRDRSSASRMVLLALSDSGSWSTRTRNSVLMFFDKVGTRVTRRFLIEASLFGALPRVSPRDAGVTSRLTSFDIGGEVVARPEGATRVHRLPTLSESPCIASRVERAAVRVEEELGTTKLLAVLPIGRRAYGGHI